MTKHKALFNWSGGKDSAMGLHVILQNDEYDISTLFTTVSEKYNRISQHGVRLELLEKQAAHIGLPLQVVKLPDTPTMESYNKIMHESLSRMKGEGITRSIFGDIFLEDLRQYREERLAEAGFEGVFPLWKRSTRELAHWFMDAGFKATVVCIDDRRLNREFTGREYDESFLDDLPDDVDPCGEFGEFHTFVYDGPVFDKPVPFELGEVVHRTYTPPKKKPDQGDSTICSSGSESGKLPGFWFCDLINGTGS